MEKKNRDQITDIYKTFNCAKKPMHDRLHVVFVFLSRDVMRQLFTQKMFDLKKVSKPSLGALQGGWWNTSRESVPADRLIAVTG